MSTRMRGPRPSSRRSTRPTRFSRTRTSGPSTTASARPGNRPRRPVHLPPRVTRTSSPPLPPAVAGPQVEFDMGGEGFSSFFDALFGSGRRPGGAQGRAGGWAPWQGESAGYAAAGANSEATISLTLEEAGRGGKREFTLTDPTTGKSRTLRVTIPKGIRPGQRIRLAGQGGPGAGRWPTGRPLSFGRAAARPEVSPRRP